MKPGLGVVLTFVVLSSVLELVPCVGFAGEAGDAGDGGPSGDGASADAAEVSSSTPAVPVACDGSLCDTTNGATCGVAKGRARASVDPTACTAILGLLALAIARRRAAHVTESSQ